MTKNNSADKLKGSYVARVFFLEFIGNRSGREVQFGPEVFINKPEEMQWVHPSPWKFL